MLRRPFARSLTIAAAVSLAYASPLRASGEPVPVPTAAPVVNAPASAAVPTVGATADAFAPSTVVAPPPASDAPASGAGSGVSAAADEPAAAAPAAKTVVAIFPLAAPADLDLQSAALSGKISAIFAAIPNAEVHLMPPTPAESLGSAALGAGAKRYVMGSLAHGTGTQLQLEIGSFDAVTNAPIAQRSAALADALGVGTIDLAPLVTTATATPAASKLVFVAFPDETTKDTYISYASEALVKRFAEKGLTLASIPPIDPIDLRFSADRLCAKNDAQGILVGVKAAHKQDYHEGAVRGTYKGISKGLSFIPIVGWVAGGVVNAAGSAMSGTVGDDDHYAGNAELSVSMLDCSGKLQWSDTTIGGVTHYGKNVAATQSTAIDEAVDKLIADYAAHRE